MYELKDDDTIFGAKGRQISKEIYEFLPKESKDKFQQSKSSKKWMIAGLNEVAGHVILDLGQAVAHNPDLEEIEPHPGYITEATLDLIAAQFNEGYFNLEDWNEDQIDFMLMIGFLEEDGNGDLIVVQ